MPEEDGSRTYASLDESTREAKDIELENLIPAHGYVNTSPSEKKHFKSYGGLFVRHLTIILDFKAEVKHLDFGRCLFHGWQSSLQIFLSPLKPM